MGGLRESGGARHNWGFTRMLQAGILERLVSPPATPKGEEDMIESSPHQPLGLACRLLQCRGRTHP